MGSQYAGRGLNDGLCCCGMKVGCKMTSRQIRRCGLLATVGAMLWTATWILVAFTADETKDVFGFSERGWRTLLLNPAVLFFMAGLAGFHAKQSRGSGRLSKIGFVICLLALGAILAGNIAEFWVFKLFYGTEGPGWGVMGVGFMMLPVGLLVIGIATMRAKVFSGWRRAVPLSFGSVLASLIVLGIGVMLLTGSGSQEGLLRAMFLSIAIGWAVMGYAVWSEEALVRGVSSDGESVTSRAK